jgi:protein-tyrosine phosphatase
MDDGATDPATSLDMLRALARQGVPDAVATPHYYPNMEDVAAYRARRRLSFEALTEYLRGYAGKDPLPRLWMGAEIALVPRLYERDLSGLFMANTDRILLELPYTSYEPWIAEELRNIRSAHNAVPVLAHLDRYLRDYRNKDIDDLLSIPDIVVQINVAAFTNRKTVYFVQWLAEAGFPLILGSDAHNTSTRTTDLSAALKYFFGKRGDRDLFEYILRSEFAPMASRGASKRGE